MLKRKISVVLYIALISFFCVYLFFKIQERDLIIQLNNNNLSLDAYKITLKQDISLAELDQKVKDNDKLTDVQLHYQAKDQRNVTYFYGKGNYTQPPLLSGHFFSSADFESDVPLAVVGKNYEKKLYEPKDQAYLKLDGNYLPVIGVMGDNYHSDLDDQIFIAASTQKLATAHTNDYRIILDSLTPIDAKTLKKELGLLSATRLVKKNFIISDESWLASHWAQVLGLFAAAVGFLAQMAVWLISSRRRYNEAVFLQANHAKFAFEEWRTYSIWVGLGTIIGGMAGIFIFQMTTYTYLLLTMGSIYLGSSLLFYLLINSRLKKSE